MPWATLPPSSIQGRAVYTWKKIQILIFLIQGPKKQNSGKHQALGRSLNKWHSKTQGLFQWDNPFWNGSLCIDSHHLLSRLWGRDFPGGPVAKALCSRCGGPRLNPWSGNQILCATTKIWQSWINKQILKKKKRLCRLNNGPKISMFLILEPGNVHFCDKGALQVLLRKWHEGLALIISMDVITNVLIEDSSRIWLQDSDVGIFQKEAGGERQVGVVLQRGHEPWNGGCL